MTKIMLKLPDLPPLPITLNTAEYGPNGYIHLYYKGNIVATIGSSDLSGFSSELHRVAARLTPRTVADVEAGIIPGQAEAEEFIRWERWGNVPNITPAQVIAYFEQSPVLAPMADDVRAALEPLASDPGENPDITRCLSHIDEIVDNNGSTKRGAQTRIAELLDIINSGPSNRKRIKRVIRTLQVRKNISSSSIELVEMGQVA